MRIQVRNHVPFTLTVQAPLSKEIFVLLFEPEVIDVTQEILDAQAQVAMAAVVERMKDPYFASNLGYSNLQAHEHGVGGTNPPVSKKQKDSGFL